MAKARAVITDELKELILADFHTGGFTQRELAQKHGVSKSAVNKLVANLTPKNATLVDNAVAIKSELAGLSGQELVSVHNVVDERTKHLIYFQNSALRNQKLSNELLDYSNDSGELSFAELESHSRITARNKETLLGKEPTTVINNQNAQISQEISVEALSSEELKALELSLSKILEE